MNVLVLESLFHQGGVEKLLHDTFRRFDSEKHKVVYCTLYEPGPMGEQIAETGVLFYHDLIRWKYDLRAVWKLRHIIRAETIDVIYLVTQPLTILWGFLASVVGRVPVVCLIGNTVRIKDSLKTNIYRLLLPFVDGIVTQAHTHKRHVVNEIAVPEKLVWVLENGIDLKELRRSRPLEETRAALGVASGSTVVGMVGRLVHLKGVDLFIEAAAMISSRHQDIVFVVVGQGEEMGRLMALSKRLGMEEKVKLLGFRDDLYDLVSLFDIAVIASRTEAFPMVLLEYMGLGKAVVATRVGSIEEIVQDGVNGRLVEPESATALAAGIEAYLDDRRSAASAGARARETVEGRYTIEGLVERTEHMLSCIVDGRTRTGPSPTV